MVHSQRRCFAILFLLAFLCASAEGAKVKVWNHRTAGDHDKARFQHAVVSSEGGLRLSRQLTALAELDVTHVWDIVEDKDGNLFVATGDEGKIYKVPPDAKAQVAFDTKESQVFCLALAPDGAIYAGTGPGGLIIRIGPDGKAGIHCDTPENYVWSLAVGPKGVLYAGTGPKGRIYRVGPDGKSDVFHATKQDHVLCLALGGDNMLYAGTDKNGLIYRIDPGGKGFVLYQAPQPEVRSLLVTPDAVYAATSALPRKRPSGGSDPERSAADVPSLPSGLHKAVKESKESKVEKDSKTRSEEAGTGPEKKPAATEPARSGNDKEADKGASSAPAALKSGENCVYRINGDGTVREIFREKALLLCLLRQDGKLLVGTGMEGRLFEVNEATRERSEIARLDHGQIHCLHRRKDGSIVVGTGDPGKLYRLQDKFAAKGTVTSDPLDAKIISKWGSLRWHPDTAVATSVSLAVRAGNVAAPDATWSDGSAEQKVSEQGLIAAPTARFLQYRVTLATENPAVTPTLQSVALRYMTTNLAPEVGSIDVPDLDATNLDSSRKIKLKWTATDPNEDELTYSILVRKDGWKSWVQLEDNLSKGEYEWDTTTTPTGTYQVKVAASDRKDNTAEDALTGERTSVPFVVSHTPPTVTVKAASMEGDQAVIEASASHPLVRLTSASFSINGKKWISVFPTDGLMDSKSETFRFKTESLKPGTHVLVLQVQDAAGNTGSGDVVFVVQAKAK